MAKVMIDDPMFKKGSYDGQKSDGLYLDGALVELMDIFSRKITDDMQFLGLFCSSTFGVRTGKSTLAQQMGYYFTSMVNKRHGLDLKFDHNNIVFKTDKLIEKAHKLPKYSVLILDEGDDLTEHSASEKSREIKKFLRKSGQLNLFIMFILPDFFEMPKTIAMQRSNFLIDVKFEDEFDRGYFEYYNFKDKKKLYARGKKFGDYDVQKATVPNGRFVNKYCVDEEKYRAMKLKDLKEQDLKDEGFIDPKIRRKIAIETFGKIYVGLKKKYGGPKSKFKITQQDMADAMGFTRKTAEMYFKEYKEMHPEIFANKASEKLFGIPNNSPDSHTPPNDTIIPTTFDDDLSVSDGGSGEVISDISNGGPINLNTSDVLKQHDVE